MTRKLRVGIDVGGTFTKAVAIDIFEGKILASATVPTTHSSVQGVSDGILMTLSRLLDEAKIENSEIELISHSTTQAVNALLEGDTAKVGIIGMGVGLEKNSIIKRTNIGNVPLAPNKYLKTCYQFLDTSKYINAEDIKDAISRLRREGAEVLTVSEAYGVDDPSNELFVVEQSKIPSTAGHELSGIYGLEIRTLTAAINAGILPRAINTAKFVESAVRSKKITSPLMIMKGDGGIMDVRTFEKKPIFTILSGPAASVAGALLHLHVLNGIFVEVGGTSTNICVIKDGKPEMRYVTIMQHPTCIRSLDVRVAGVAGGSLIRWSGKKITDIGPRSAHISGLPYSCFADPSDLESGQIITFAPKDGDPMDYVAIEVGGGKRFAITNTCAANAIGVVPISDYAHGNTEAARLAMSILGRRINCSPEETARIILDKSSKKVQELMEPMIKEYGLRRDQIVMIGGGGGAAVLVPYLAEKLKLQYKIPGYAEIISCIGVAAALVYEEREKTIDNPSVDDISSLVNEVKEAALQRGAHPESLSLQSSYISERSLLRATASGNISLDIGSSKKREISEEEARILACELFGMSEGVNRIFDMENYHVFACEINKRKLFLRSKKRPVLVFDKYGRVRLSVDNATVLNGTPNELLEKLHTLLESEKRVDKYSDFAPQIHILDGSKIVDFSSLTAREQILQAIKDELRSTTTEQVAAVIRI
ncbi:MAG TPA: hydantoinase/oxoprolinase family protein [Nitrososphaeraceae archaeon]|nr:hydantoinase/oxoprolinase family protein [Nitrososphaeraceae archaeon]